MRQLREIAHDMSSVAADIEDLQSQENDIQAQLTKLYLFQDQLTLDLRKMLDAHVE